MKNTPVGIAILTNGSRLDYLKACVQSFLANCYYRPLIFGVWDNGSTDDTPTWLKKPPTGYGVEWRVGRSPMDLGCAVGTNRSIGLVKDCEYVIHLESDFEHLPPLLSGESTLWLHRALDFMRTGVCDYMYLRRMVDERDIFQHWWSQWMRRITMTSGDGKYLRCDDFWWSNNPTLFRTKALYDCGTLPLNESKDGAKGTPGWSKPELEAPRPTKAWIHKWGLFVHELPRRLDLNTMLGMSQCPGDTGASKCKYGFFLSGASPFCACCNRALGFDDMENHAGRFVGK